MIDTVRAASETTGAGLVVAVIGIPSLAAILAWRLVNWRRKP